MKSFKEGVEDRCEPTWSCVPSEAGGAGWAGRAFIRLPKPVCLTVQPVINVNKSVMRSAIFYSQTQGVLHKIFTWHLKGISRKNFHTEKIQNTRNWFLFLMNSNFKKIFYNKSELIGTFGTRQTRIWMHHIISFIFGPDFLVFFTLVFVCAV